jgi:hypothetical protein
MQIEKKISEIPTVSSDYMNLGDGEHRSKGESEKDEKGMPILEARDDQTKMTMAAVVPEKERNPYSVTKLSNFIQLLGYQKLVVKSDNQSCIMALKRAAKGESEVELVFEESPVGDNDGNGMVEATIKQIQGQFRTMKSALEERIQEKVGRDHSVSRG